MNLLNKGLPWFCVWDWWHWSFVHNLCFVEQRFMLCSQSSTGESPFKEEGLVYGRTFVRCNICQLGNLTGLLCILFLSKINVCAAAAAPFSLIDHCQCIAIYQQLIKWSDCTICGENIAAVSKRKCLVQGDLCHLQLIFGFLWWSSDKKYSNVHYSWCFPFLHQGFSSLAALFTTSKIIICGDDHDDQHNHGHCWSWWLEIWRFGSLARLFTRSTPNTSYSIISME